MPCESHSPILFVNVGVLFGEIVVRTLAYNGGGQPRFGNIASNTQIMRLPNRSRFMFSMISSYMWMKGAMCYPIKLVSSIRDGIVDGRAKPNPNPLVWAVFGDVTSRGECAYILSKDKDGCFDGDFRRFRRSLNFGDKYNLPDCVVALIDDFVGPLSQTAYGFTKVPRDCFMPGGRFNSLTLMDMFFMDLDEAVVPPMVPTLRTSAQYTTFFPDGWFPHFTFTYWCTKASNASHMRQFIDYEKLRAIVRLRLVNVLVYIDVRHQSHAACKHILISEYYKLIAEESD